MKRSVSLGVRRRGCIPKLLLAAMLVAIALVTSGCFISATWVFDPGVYQLTGTVFFGPKDLLMDGATVQLAEPYKDPFRLTQTNVDGRFSFSGVPEGIYTLTVDSRAGLERETVHLSADKDIKVTLPYPSVVAGQPFREADFLDISALWYWNYDRDGFLQRFSVPNLRWFAGTRISIFIDDGSGSDPGWPVPNDAWRNGVWNYVRDYWHDLPVSWDYASNADTSHLEIQWWPAGWLGEYVAAETQLKDVHGYLYKVIMMIDERYVSLELPVFAHELWHSLGVGHVNDQFSVMHPQITTYQKSPFCLTDAQKEYLWLAYAIRPNQTVPVPADASKEATSVRAMKVAAAPAVVTVLTRADGSSTTVQGVPDFIQRNPRVRKMLAEAQAKGQSGFLWDQIKIDDK
jgi:hypothetical protein